jgi:hypothetical protein
LTHMFLKKLKIIPLKYPLSFHYIIRSQNHINSQNHSAKLKQMSSIKMNNALGKKNKALGKKNEALRKMNAALKNENNALGKKNNAVGKKNNALGKKNKALKNEKEALGKMNAALTNETKTSVSEHYPQYCGEPEVKSSQELQSCYLVGNTKVSGGWKIDPPLPTKCYLSIGSTFLELINQAGVVLRRYDYVEDNIMTTYKDKPSPCVDIRVWANSDRSWINVKSPQAEEISEKIYEKANEQILLHYEEYGFGR